MKQKIEVKQDDITVQERIIQFFQRVFSREDAERLYFKAESIGMNGGVHLFDQAIDMICKDSGLDSNELAKEIKDHTIYEGDPDQAHEDAIHNLGNNQ